jgi:hypothetical protein
LYYRGRSSRTQCRLEPSKEAIRKLGLGNLRCMRPADRAYNPKAYDGALEVF